MIEMSLDDLISLYNLSSVGKLIGGLIHNINGPLQNIGLDVEMLEYVLKGESDTQEQKIEKIRSRLKRIIEELDRLNHMIKTVSSRTAVYEEENIYMNINDYLQQELSFLSANLYFKHNIDTELRLTDNPPLTRDLPDNSVRALSLLFENIADEMEKARATKLGVVTEIENGLLKISFSIHKRALSQDLINLMNQEITDSEKTVYKGENAGILLALTIFKKGGISFRVNDDSTESVIALELPLTQ